MIPAYTDERATFLAAGVFIGVMLTFVFLIAAHAVFGRPIVNWEAHCISRGGVPANVEGIDFCDYDARHQYP